MREARYDDQAELDEVVADDVAGFHMERLDSGCWFVGLTHHDGTITHIVLSAKLPGTTKVMGKCEFDT